MRPSGLEPEPSPVHEWNTTICTMDAQQMEQTRSSPPMEGTFLPSRMEAKVFLKRYNKFEKRFEILSESFSKYFKNFFKTF